MRLVSIILVAISIAIASSTWLERRGLFRGEADTPLLSNEIRIAGRGNTLASIARQVRDSRAFNYDPLKRTAVSQSTLVIEGELEIGRPDDPASGEYLELATQACGDLRIEVRPTGVLRLYHSGLRTVSQLLSANACSRGYALFVDGELEMNHSRIEYISGSTSQCLRGKARARIRQSTFSWCDGIALSCINVDGSRILLEGSETIGHGNWGLMVQGSGGAPLEARNCVFDGAIGAVFLTGESPSVRLIDCTFDPAKIVFHHSSGQVAVAWTRRFQVIDALTKRPRMDVRVRAETINGDSGAIEAQTDAKGLAEITFTERLLRPPNAERTVNGNAAPHHRIAVLEADGRIVARMADIDVRGKDSNPVVIEVRSAREARSK